MSAENRFFNFHLKADCRNNSKVGFQSLDSDVQALQKGLGCVRTWAENEKLQDGDTIVIYARYTETDAAEELHMDELQMADGTTRALDEEPVEAAPDTEADETDEIPF